MVTSAPLHKVRGTFRNVSSAESAGSLRIPGTKIEAVTGKVVKPHAQLGAHHWVNDALENEIVCVLGLLPSCKCKLGWVKKINNSRA